MNINYSVWVFRKLFRCVWLSVLVLCSLTTVFKTILFFVSIAFFYSFIQHSLCIYYVPDSGCLAVNQIKYCLSSWSFLFSPLGLCFFFLSVFLPVFSNLPLQMCCEPNNRAIRLLGQWMKNKWILSMVAYQVWGGIKFMDFVTSTYAFYGSFLPYFWFMVIYFLIVKIGRKGFPSIKIVQD